MFLPEHAAKYLNISSFSVLWNCDYRMFQKLTRCSLHFIKDFYLSADFISTAVSDARD